MYLILSTSSFVAKAYRKRRTLKGKSSFTTKCNPRFSLRNNFVHLKRFSKTGCSNTLKRSRKRNIFSAENPNIFCLQALITTNIFKLSAIKPQIIYKRKFYRYSFSLVMVVSTRGQKFAYSISMTS